MTMSVIGTFKIGEVSLDSTSKSRKDLKSRADTLQGYTVTECSLTKELLKPNEFRFTLRRDSLKKPTQETTYNLLKSIIGKSVDCNIMTTVKVGNTIQVTYLVFKGPIFNVSLKGSSFNCVAYSPDASLQGAPKSRCFINTKISDVVNTVASEINRKQVALQAELEKLVFPLIIQYNESDYDFLARLAKRFGAFCYYGFDAERNNSSFVFGKLPKDTTIDLTKDAKKCSVAGVSYELQTGDPTYRYAAHFYEKNEDYKSPGADFGLVEAKHNGKMELVVDGSTAFDNQNYFVDLPIGLAASPAEDDVETYNDIKVFSDADQLVTIKFTSYLFDLDVGNIIKLSDQNLYVVTSAHLTWDCSGSPQNEITAFALPKDSVDTDLIFAPYMDYNDYPKSSAQRAVVVDNVDPLKMGRVQVQFLWQQDPADDNEKKKLPWIRIAQPYGGGKKDKGQGFYLLPENGEEVMVGFEHDNMEKPFVIGTLYHNSDTADDVQMPEESWVETDQANKKNEVKAFRTKKGHTIEFHDVDGQDKYGFIRIYGNEKKEGPNYDIILSTDLVQKKNGDSYENYKAQSAFVDDNEDDLVLRDYDLANLRILVRSNGGDIMFDAGENGDIILNAKNIRVHTKEDVTAFIGRDDVIKTTRKRLVETEEAGVHVINDRTVQIDKKDVYSSNMLRVEVTEDYVVSAQSLSLKTEQKTEIKAQSINTNTKQNTEIVAQTFKASAREEINLFGSNKVTITSNKDVGVLGMSKATLQGAETNVTGMSKINLKAPSGTRVGSWTDM